MISLFLFCSCQKDSNIRFGFDTNFEKDTIGITIMNVDHTAKFITLAGEVIVDEGEVLVELIDPNGKLVFSEQFDSSIIGEVNDTISAIPGNWRLKYKSIKGIGLLKMHLIALN